MPKRRPASDDRRCTACLQRLRKRVIEHPPGFRGGKIGIAIHIVLFLSFVVVGIGFPLPGILGMVAVAASFLRLRVAGVVEWKYMCVQCDDEFGRRRSMGAKVDPSEFE